jgi:sterol desaturase/sphingolipid hydroxylase (fatty acid hydroxylase superfamily)
MGGEHKKQPSLAVQAAQVLIAMVVMDTWQYFIHRLMHVNKFLYKHIHSQHHRLVVPYGFGALYNHPAEGFLLDTIGGAVSFLVSGMTPRTATFFFSLWMTTVGCGFQGTHSSAFSPTIQHSSAFSPTIQHTMIFTINSMATSIISHNPSL